MKPAIIDFPEYAEISVITTDYIYEARARVGALSSESVWQVWRTNTASPFIKTWADGNADFDNVSSNLVALIYS